jgi:hypothetical protein
VFTGGSHQRFSSTLPGPAGPSARRCCSRSYPGRPPNARSRQGRWHRLTAEDDLHDRRVPRSTAPAPPPAPSGTWLGPLSRAGRPLCRLRLLHVALARRPTVHLAVLHSWPMPSFLVRCPVRPQRSPEVLEATLAVYQRARELLATQETAMLCLQRLGQSSA